MGNRNSGRRPQPTALKVLRGNPGQRKLNEHEPKPPSGEVERPALAADALIVWERVAPIAIAMGTLTSADVEAFKTLCRLQARLDQLDMESADKLDAAKLEKDLASAIRPYYAMFGLEPSGRAKISLPKKSEEQKSKWAGVLK